MTEQKKIIALFKLSFVSNFKVQKCILMLQIAILAVSNQTTTTTNNINNKDITS